MKKIPQFVWTILACLLCVVVTAAACLLTANKGATSDKYLEIIKVIGSDFYQETDAASLENASADAMVASLGDSWSSYMTADEYAQYKLQEANQYVGIGITTEASEKYGFLAVTSVTAGSPADAAHIKIGNMIAAVNSTDVSAFTPEEFNALCVSFGSETFTLHLLNSQGGKATADVKCELINANPVIYEMFDKTTIGYVRIENFESNTASGLKAAVKALEDAGASALIFDIRDNTGGKTAELADSLDYLLPKGDMFLLQDRNGKETVYTSGASSVNLPMVVIVNENTACAAEVFAEVLQSGGAATIVGTQTGGNSQSQVTVELSDGSAVRLSKYLYLTPDRKTLAELGGVRPDVVSNAIEDSALDVQLEAAKDVVS